MNRFFSLSRVAVLAGALATLSFAGTVVSPGTDVATEGNTNNGFPFSIGIGSMRYQQIYAASEFSALGPILITGIMFRPDAQTGAAFSSNLSNIQIDLSTTSRTPATLGTAFASNVGGDDLVVFNGALSLSSAFTGPVGGPKAFDIIINLTTPFLYNPANGSLLMDVRNFGGGLTTQFDADGLSTAIQRVWVLDVTSSNGQLNTIANGLVTQFVYGTAAVPEPSTIVMLTLMGLGVVGSRLRRKQ